MCVGGDRGRSPGEKGREVEEERVGVPRSWELREIEKEIATFHCILQ